MLFSISHRLDHIKLYGLSHLSVAFRFFEPLVSGDYPDTMRKFVGEKIPKFSENQSRSIVGAFDFIGLNYYSVLAVREKISNITDQDQRDYLIDTSVELSGYTICFPILFIAPLK